MNEQQIKAMELAIEALKHGIREMNMKGCAVECMPLHEAITAIKEALAHKEPDPEEDARLIASAPDLLEALEYIDSENASEEVLRRARAAIAKAGGAA